MAALSKSAADWQTVLAEAFTGATFDAFALEYFREVHDQFLPGMSLGQRIELLLRWCEETAMLPHLRASLDKVSARVNNAESRPGAVGLFTRRLDHVFISHSHTDAAFARRLARDLREHGWQPWIAPDSIAPGEKWADAIERGLAECRVFVIVASDAALRSEWVKYEVRVATKLADLGQAHFVPLNISTATREGPWSAFQWVSFADDYAEGIRELLGSLEASRQPPFAATMLVRERPASLAEITLPNAGSYFPSPSNWADEVIYSLIVDRFSDAREQTRPLIDRANLEAARPNPWRWDAWTTSAGFWQGGTLQGVRSKLPYLRRLGVTVLRLTPVLKQRIGSNTYRGLAAQDFLDVDPHIGTRRDLADLISEAHGHGMRIILDIVLNHSAPNWQYLPSAGMNAFGGVPYTTGRHPFGAWVDENWRPIDAIRGADDGVWPSELQDPECYVRAGSGQISPFAPDDPNAEFRRSDFVTFRKFEMSKTLPSLVDVYKYWIALVNCDGFYVDFTEYLAPGEVRFFCESIREFAERLGKVDFCLLGEGLTGVPGTERIASLRDMGLTAMIESTVARRMLTDVAKGLMAPAAYFKSIPSSFDVRNRQISVLDDPDNLAGRRERFDGGPVGSGMAGVALALQMFTLGIPSIYYGTEQLLGGPEPAARRQLSWDPDSSTFLLHEAMFGPEHPRRMGRKGLSSGAAGAELTLPGFGAFGTAGAHCFDENHSAYLRIAELLRIRRARSPLRLGRQYLRPSRSSSAAPFTEPGAGELVAWSRILAAEELLCIVNPNASRAQGAEVLVDRTLNPAGSSLGVILNTDPASPHPVGTALAVRDADDNAAFVRVQQLAPGGVLVLSNRA